MSPEPTQLRNVALNYPHVLRLTYFKINVMVLLGQPGFEIGPKL